MPCAASQRVQPRHLAFAHVQRCRRAAGEVDRRRRPRIRWRSGAAMPRCAAVELGDEAVGRGGQHHEVAGAAVALDQLDAPRRRCAARPLDARNARAAAPTARASGRRACRRRTSQNACGLDGAARVASRSICGCAAANSSRSSTPASIRKSHHSTSLSPSSSVWSRSNSVSGSGRGIEPALSRRRCQALRPREGLDAVGRQRQADAGVADARPRQPRAHAVAAVPVDACRRCTLREQLARRAPRRGV